MDQNWTKTKNWTMDRKLLDQGPKIVHGPKIGLWTMDHGKLDQNQKIGPWTKIGLHAFHVNLYLHEFFEPILFFDPHGL